MIVAPRPEQLDLFPQELDEVLRVRRLEQGQLELVLNRGALQHKKVWGKRIRQLVSNL